VRTTSYKFWLIGDTSPLTPVDVLIARREKDRKEDVEVEIHPGTSKPHLCKQILYTTSTVLHYRVVRKTRCLFIPNLTYPREKQMAMGTTLVPEEDPDELMYRVSRSVWTLIAAPPSPHQGPVYIAFDR